MKLLKEKSSMTQTSSANTTYFASQSLSLCLVSMSDKDKFWIVDIGTTNHMCSNPYLFDEITPLEKKKPVHLFDGTCQFVTHKSHVTLFNKIKLKNVLYVPNSNVLCYLLVS